MAHRRRTPPAPAIEADTRTEEEKIKAELIDLFEGLGLCLFTTIRTAVHAPKGDPDSEDAVATVSAQWRRFGEMLYDFAEATA